MTIAAIVPVLNDTGPLTHCLADLAVAQEAIEIHVVDGEDDPEARALCASRGAHYHRSPPGRAHQLNLGAAATKADWLWFLHADTRISSASINAILEHAAQEQPSWGCFRHKIDHGSVALRVIERSANLRARLGLPYGDQALFVHTDLFREAGGFPQEPILEDLLLSKTLRKISRPHVLAPPVISSGRRWRNLGIARTTWRNWRILAMLLAGSRDTTRMATLYHRHAGRPETGRTS